MHSLRYQCRVGGGNSNLNNSNIICFLLSMIWTSNRIAVETTPRTVWKGIGDCHQGIIITGMLEYSQLYANGTSEVEKILMDVAHIRLQVTPQICKYHLKKEYCSKDLFKTESISKRSFKCIQKLESVGHFFVSKCKFLYFYMIHDRVMTAEALLGELSHKLGGWPC